MVLAVAIVVIIIAGALYWLLRVLPAQPSEKERQLLKICMNDREQAERLIRHEVERSPGISRFEAADRAVWWYERDRR